MPVMVKPKLLTSEIFYDEPKIFDFVESEQTEINVDGKHILGIVRGQFFNANPNIPSRNRRVYTKEFWQSVLDRPEIQEKLNLGLMGGQIGHKETPISDDDWNNGLVSHYMTKLWIDENGRGMGEAVILGSEAGQRLYTYLKAKCRFFVSSRASGDYKEGLKINGLPVVDENSYYLDCFDFVREPGFLQAQPSIIESSENSKMPEEQNKIQESLDNISSRLSVLEKTNVSEDVKTLQEKLNSYEKKYSFLESVDKNVFENLKSLSVNEMNQLFSKVKITGKPRKTAYFSESFNYDSVFIPTRFTNISVGKLHSVFTESLKDNYPININIVEKENKQFNENGILLSWKDGSRPDSIIENIKKIISDNAGIIFEGEGCNTNSLVEELNEYRKIAPAKEIQEKMIIIDKKLAELIQFKKLGKVESIAELSYKINLICETLNKYGSLDKVVKSLKEHKQVKEKYQKMVNKTKKSVVEEKAKKYSAQFNLPVDTVKKVLESTSENLAVDILKSLTNKELPAKNEKKEPIKGTFSVHRNVREKIYESMLFDGGLK